MKKKRLQRNEPSKSKIEFSEKVKFWRKKVSEQEQDKDSWLGMIQGALFGGHYHTMLQTFLKKCMKSRNFWSVGWGGGVVCLFEGMHIWALDTLKHLNQ